MSLCILLQEATTHFMRSQFIESLSKLQDARETAPSKTSVIHQCLLASNCIVCSSQLPGFSAGTDSKLSQSLTSFEDLKATLRGVPPSKNRAIVDCVLQYNHLISILQRSLPHEIRANATSVVSAIQEYLSKDIVQTLDDSETPVVLLRCALMAGQILAGMEVTDWTIPGECHRFLKDSWCTAVVVPTGCKVLTTSVRSSDDSLPLEGLMCLMKCVKACQGGSWLQALKIAKRRKLWKGHLATEMTYVRAFCLYQLASYDEAKQCLRKFLLRPDLTPSLKADGHQLLACCLAKQGKYHLALTEFNKALSLSSQDPLVLPLLNLSVVFRKLQNRDAEMATLNQLVKVSSEPHPQANGPGLVFHPDASQHLSTLEIQIKSIYRVAHRSLHLERVEEAAERYLDLIALLEESSIVKLSYSMKCPVEIPSTMQVYLEAALALLKSQRFAEAKTICDIVIRRSACLTVKDEVFSLPTSSGDSIHDLNLGSEIRTNNASTQNDPNAVESSLRSQSVSERRDASSGTNISQSISEVTAVVSLCLIKSECMLNLKDYEGSVTTLDDALFICNHFSSEEQTESGDGMPAKKRRLEQGMTQTDTQERLRSLKGRAYNNKALILIGQGRLSEALPSLVSSQECCPENVDAKRNLCLLLFKMGRKKEAYSEWRKMQTTSSTTD